MNNSIKTAKIPSAWPWILGLSSAVLLSSCGPDLDVEAESLFNKVTAQANTMLAANNYRDAFKDYSTTADLIDKLLTEYPNSATVSELENGTTNIAGLRLQKFLLWEKELKSLAVAEHDILACASVLALNNNIQEERCFNYIIIAEANIKVGKSATATNLLVAATDAADNRTNQLSRAHAYTRIAEVYDELGATNLADEATATAEQLAVSFPAKDHGDAISKSYSLAEAALRHLAAGNEEQTEYLTGLAIETRIDNETPRPYSRIADLFEEAGYFDRAITLMEKADRDDFSFTYVIRRMVEKPRTDEELLKLSQLAATITDEYSRDRALSTLAAHYAARSHFISAKMLQSSLENEFCEDGDLWKQVAMNHATEKRINEAFNTINLMRKVDNQVDALVATATVLHELGEQQIAANSLASALNIAQTHSFRIDYEMTGKVAAKYKQLGYPEKSNELLKYYTNEALSINRPWSKANALNDLSTAYIVLNDIDTAVELLILARESAAEDPKSGLKLNQIAENLAGAGQYEEAFNTAEMIKDDSKYKLDAYVDLAELYAEALETELVQRCLREITDEDELDDLFEDLFEIYLEQDRPLLAMEYVDKMQEAYDRHNALTETAIHYAKGGNYQKAFETTRMITNVSSQVSALIDLATVTESPVSLDTQGIEALTLIISDHYPMDTFWKTHTGSVDAVIQENSLVDK